LNKKQQPVSSLESYYSYAHRLHAALSDFDWQLVAELEDDFFRAWQKRTRVWICGNGGSAANAVHWANDFLYPVAKQAAYGIRISALTANPAVLTCLGNDLGYDQAFSYPLKTDASAGDILIVLSGSGNSPNILEVLRVAKSLQIKSYAIVGFDGGKARELADVLIHFAVQDMQIAEDAQMVVCHALVQALTPRISQASTR
jgi:D-sedoheptulose 7-phosphate isomerase